MKIQQSRLEGRLEAVKIVTAVNSTSAIGKLKGNVPVFVANGAGYLNKSCLVKFDFNFDKHKRYPTARFISSRVSKEFAGLGAEEFVLYGKWYKMWKKKGKYPTFTEINEHYDPGKMGSVLYIPYIPEKFRDNPKKIIIAYDKEFNGYEFNEIFVSIQHAIESYLPDPAEYSRVAIAETSWDLKSLKKQIKNNDLIPIEMKPIASFSGSL